MTEDRIRELARDAWVKIGSPGSIVDAFFGQAFPAYEPWAPITQAIRVAVFEAGGDGRS